MKELRGEMMRMQLGDFLMVCNQKKNGQKTNVAYYQQIDLRIRKVRMFRMVRYGLVVREVRRVILGFPFTFVKGLCSVL